MKEVEIYFPMTANILTAGHVKCIEALAKRGFVTIGLLTKKALKGYKQEIVPYRDRKYIMDAIATYVEDVTVVPQDSLDPTENLKKYRSTHIASGDGWEESERRAIAKLGITPIDLRLPRETSKRYSSTNILNAGLRTKK